MSDSGLQIRALTAADASAWDRFVEGSPDGTFFHLSGWQRVIERAFGHGTHFMLAEDANGIRAVLPLVRVKSLLFGDNLASIPFGVYGGVLAADEPARLALTEAACDLARKLGVGSLELRNRRPQNPDWPTKDLYFTFRKEIDPDPEVNLKAIPRKQRAMVRKGIKAGLSGEPDDGYERVYRIYAESVRNLGTPVFPKRHFRILREEFGDAVDVLVITHQGQDIAAVMSFYFRDEVLPFYGGSLPIARNVKGNDFMYWDLMCRAAERGCRIFDYGRSKEGTGSFSFKKNWGFEPEPLYYEYFLVKDKAMPEVNPNNPKYKYFIQAWQRLPLPVANRIGPWLSPYLA